ncbi:hypothetical protein C0995_014356 [Termitomyces sp. Mi166|nr:hypothetical protein C0995_014356 [Termitomyces sp. Mi166\
MQRNGCTSEYHCVVVGKLTAQEFVQQRQEVKDNWAKHLLKAKKSSEYVDMRGRMLSRKRKRAPCSSSELTIKDVIASLVAGEEQIDVARMNCVLYDHEFAEGLSSALNTWTPKITTVTKKEKTKKRGQRGARRADDDDETRSEKD